MTAAVRESDALRCRRRQSLRGIQLLGVRSGATALSESGHRHTVRHHDYAIQAEVPGAVAAARYTAHAAT